MCPVPFVTLCLDGVFDAATYQLVRFIEIVQRGSEAVMGYLSSEAQAGRVERVLFLMPCHATPYYSSLHTNLPMRFLDCSPRYIVSYLFIPVYWAVLFSKYMHPEYILNSVGTSMFIVYFHLSS